MRFKKCFAMFSVIFILCLSILPSFASAEEFDLLESKQAYNMKTNVEDTFVKGNESNISDLFKKEVVFDIGFEARVKRFEFNASKGVQFTYIKFLDSSFKSINTYKLENIKTTVDVSLANIKYVVVGNSGTNSVSFNYLKVIGSDGRVSEVTNLDAKADVNKVSFTWDNPIEEDFTGVKIYEGERLINLVNKPLNSYVVDGLEANTYYYFKLVAIDEKGNETKGVTKTVKTLVDPKKIPPGPVSSFTAEPTDKTVKLKWKSPKDDDLAGFKILQNGKQVAEIGLEEEFTVKNLEPLTEYNFGVVAVDKDKNDSTSVNLSVKTLDEKDDEPPHVPSNVFAKPSNGALIASWDKVSDKDLVGYNVYVDDKKINSNLISSTNFTIKNLENNRKYKIQVQAVDRSGNASALSLAAYGTPDERTLPIIESKYSLQDVSDGVSVMFGQFWTVLAFAVGIPLAFYIIYKLKLTVLP